MSTSGVRPPSRRCKLSPGQDPLRFHSPLRLLTRYLREHSERLGANRTTHRWFYSGNFTNISPRWWMGAYHESELPLLFGTHMDFRGNSTQFEYELSYVMQDAYVAFVTDPQNGLDALNWPAYQGLGGDVMQWGDISNLTLSHLTTVTSIEDGCKTRGLL